MFLRWRRYLIS